MTEVINVQTLSVRQFHITFLRGGDDTVKALPARASVWQNDFCKRSTEQNRFKRFAFEKKQSRPHGETGKDGSKLFFCGA